jgi:hypothetical protein
MRALNTRMARSLLFATCRYLWVAGEGSDLVLVVGQLRLDGMELIAGLTR